MTLTIILLSIILLVAILAILILVGRVCRLYDMLEQEKQLSEFWRNERENGSKPSAKA